MSAIDNGVFDIGQHVWVEVPCNPRALLIGGRVVSYRQECQPKVDGSCFRCGRVGCPEGGHTWTIYEVCLDETSHIVAFTNHMLYCDDDLAQLQALAAESAMEVVEGSYELHPLVRLLGTERSHVGQHVWVAVEIEPEYHEIHDDEMEEDVYWVGGTYLGATRRLVVPSVVPGVRKRAPFVVMTYVLRLDADDSIADYLPAFRLVSDPEYHIIQAQKVLNPRVRQHVAELCQFKWFGRTVPPLA